MKVWYFIRRPIGVLLFSYLIFLGLAVLHAIPEVAFLIMTGQI